MIYIIPTLLHSIFLSIEAVAKTQIYVLYEQLKKEKVANESPEENVMAMWLKSLDMGNYNA